MMVPSTFLNRMLYYPPIRSFKQTAAGYLQAPSSEVNIRPQRF
jgi:hypothetical protein